MRAALQMAADLPAQFLADWAADGVHAQHQQRALAPAEAAAPGGKGLLAAAAASLASLALDAAPSGATPDAGAAPGGSAVERVAACAVSLAFLSDFYTRCVAQLERGGPLLTTKDVVERVIKPATQATAGSCNFASLMPGAVAPPATFASHAFGNPFRLLVSALQEHFMNAVAADVYIWVDISPSTSTTQAQTCTAAARWNVPSSWSARRWWCWTAKRFRSRVCGACTRWAPLRQTSCGC